jgi:hypothetical protein
MRMSEVSVAQLEQSGEEVEIPNQIGVETVSQGEADNTDRPRPFLMAWTKLPLAESPCMTLIVRDIDLKPRDQGGGVSVHGLKTGTRALAYSEVSRVTTVMPWC